MEEKKRKIIRTALIMAHFPAVEKISNKTLTVNTVKNDV